MPCDGSYLEATGREVELSRVAALLDEVHGRGSAESNEHAWEGYHPRVYSRHLSDAKADEMVAELCAWCQTHDVTAQSLELQIWWRDHQKADAERIQCELNKKLNKEARKAALAKLTPYERKILGLK